MDVDVVEEVVTEKRVHVADAVVQLRSLFGLGTIVSSAKARFVKAAMSCGLTCVHASCAVM